MEHRNRNRDANPTARVQNAKRELRANQPNSSNAQIHRWANVVSLWRGDNRLRLSLIVRNWYCRWYNQDF